MTHVVTSKEAPAMTTESGAEGGPVVIDLGKQPRKHVRALRKGKPGKLLDEVMETLETLRAQKSIPADAQPIIVVVREKSKRTNLLGL
jgi:hypothetical protein